MEPKQWFEDGRRLSTAFEKELYYMGGLKLGNAFLPWAWVGFGDARLAQGDKDAAIAGYKKALEMDPSFTPAWNRLHNHTLPPEPSTFEKVMDHLRDKNFYKKPGSWESLPPKLRKRLPENEP